MGQPTTGQLRQRCWRFIHGAHDTELAPLLLSLTAVERERLYSVLRQKLEYRSQWMAQRRSGNDLRAAFLAEQG